MSAAPRPRPRRAAPHRSPIDFPACPGSPTPAQPGLVSVAKSLSAAEIHTALDRLSQAIAARHPSDSKLVLLGIANGGITLVRRLGARLRQKYVGTLDISFHRDDIGRNPIPKEFSPTVIPTDVNGAVVILVDDVLFHRTHGQGGARRALRSRPPSTGRTRCADRPRQPQAAHCSGFRWLRTSRSTTSEKIDVILDPARPANDTVASHHGKVRRALTDRPFSASCPGPAATCSRSKS
jgi:pyrimidine operon attenuation protein/uracil phosphoribosyltransferase